MARIPREVVEAVRDRTDIVEVVSRHVKLTKRGDSWVGLCPFHQEKSPSFHVIPKKAIFHCFGCQTSGDVFKFLKELEGVEFAEAVKQLAGPAGITIEERQISPSELAQLRQRATLFDVLEEAAKFFEHQLWTAPDAQAARDYVLTKRAMTPDTARAARLGWAPDGWSRLVDHFQRNGHRAELLLEAGLIKKRERGDGYYDAFRARVIVPIRDERHRVIAFGGRLMEGEGPKYINSPETELYHKGRVLYGLDAARRAVGQKDRLVLVEGYFDVLSMHQAGFHEAVATCGTALTRDHVQKIRPLTRNVVVLTDADEAGQRAAEKMLPLLSEAGIQALRLQIPGAKDPDELIREEGPAAMEKALGSTEPLLTWVAHRKLAAHGYGASARERTRDELADLLGGLTTAQVSDLAPILRLDERELLTWARAFRPAAPSAAEPAPEDVEPTPTAPPWKPDRDLTHLLWLVIHRYDHVADLAERIHPDLLEAHAPVVPAFARLVEGESVANVLDDFPDRDVRRVLAAITARTELYAPDEAAQAIADVAARLGTVRLEVDKARAQAAVADAAGSADAVRDAVGTLQRVQARQRRLAEALRRSDWRAVIDEASGTAADAPARPPPRLAAVTLLDET